MIGKNIEFLNLKKEYKEIKKEIDKTIQRVLDSGRFIGGEEVERFEEEIAKYCGVKYAISVNSGTDALYLSMKSLGIGQGDEVITTPFTFIATAGAIMNLGAKPVFVDIQDDFNINSDLIENKINFLTKAILPVHLFGKMVEMKKILKLAEKYNLYVIEDVAQSMGAKWLEKKAGSIGTVGCLSFFPTKNLGAYGDGGMILTNDENTAKKLRMLKNHGIISEYCSRNIGINSRLDAIQAAILRVKLKYLDKKNEERRKIAKYYCEKLNQEFFPNSVYHQFTIRVKDNRLVKVDFPTKIYYPIPLHLQPIFESFGYWKGDFPKAEKASKEVISLPMTTNKREQNKIINQIKKYV